MIKTMVIVKSFLDSMVININTDKAVTAKLMVMWKIKLLYTHLHPSLPASNLPASLLKPQFKLSSLELHSKGVPTPDPWYDRFDAGRQFGKDRVPFHYLILGITDHYEKAWV